MLCVVSLFFASRRRHTSGALVTGVQTCALPIDALYERLPAVPPSDRRAAADRWLLKAQGVTGHGIRTEIIESALAIIEDAAFAPLFAPDVLAEAPIAAIVGEEVIAGTVDRLRVTETQAHVVDFKTGRFVPANAAAVPRPHLRQMAAYAAALRVIFPDRKST